MATHYEWDIEEWDEHEDIIDHEHSDKLLQYRFAAIDGVKFHLVLVRNVGNQVEGLQKRAWAYATKDKATGNWVLPDLFDDDYKVPERFHVELAKIQ